MEDSTPKERVMRAINCEEVDKVPVIPQLTYATARWKDLSISNAMIDNELQMNALLHAQETCNHDGIYAQWENSSVLLRSAMGAKMIIFEDISPRVNECLVETPKSADYLCIPNPKNAGRIPVNIKLIKNLSKNVGDKLAILSYIPGPFSFTCDLMGLDNALDTVVKDPEFMKKVMEFARIASITLGIAKIQAGAHILTVAEPYANFDNISPKQFEDLCLPFIKKLISEVCIRNTKIGLHICGNSEPLIDLMTETGADFLELDSKVNLAAISKSIKKEICLSGNIDVTGLLMKPAIEIKKECRALIDKMDQRGFILSSGCEIRFRTPIENICNMVKSRDL